MSDFAAFDVLTKEDTSKLPAFFYMESVPNTKRSEEEGRAIHDAIEYIQIIFPGDHTREIKRPATDEDKRKYADEYARFKDGREQMGSGTPLTAWGVLHESTVADLKALRVFTVEQLAALSEIGIGKLGMGGRDMVAKAQAFVSKDRDNATLRARLDEKDGEIAELREQIMALQDQLHAPEEAPRRGRKPRDLDANAA